MSEICTITGVDPGPSNMTVYKYDLEKKTGVAWGWIDLRGRKITKPTSKQLKERLVKTFNEAPWLFDSDVILVEKQNRMSRACHKIEKTFKKHFGDRCEVVCPKKTKKNVLNRLKESHALGKTKKAWETKGGPGREYSEVMKYMEKKKAAISLGRKMMTGVERLMFSKIKDARKVWGTQIAEYDKKMIESNRTARKSPRKIKTRCDDLFDAMIIALDRVCDLTQTNEFHNRLHFTPAAKKEAVPLIDLT